MWLARFVRATTSGHLGRIWRTRNVDLDATQLPANTKALSILGLFRLRGCNGVTGRLVVDSGRRRGGHSGGAEVGRVAADSAWRYGGLRPPCDGTQTYEGTDALRHLETRAV